MGRAVRHIAGLGVLCLAVFTFAVAKEKEEEGLIPELKLFSKAISVVQEAYVGETTPRNLLYQAVKGMLGSLDKFSEFIDPDRFKLLEIQIKGEYAGIGVILGLVNEQIVIRAVEPGKPADKAGLLVNDVILKVDGRSVEKKPIMEVSGMLRGEAETPVTITILRAPKNIFDVTVQRQKIEIQSVQDIRMVGKALGYFRLASWQEHTAEQVDKALDELKKKGMKALIIDLRNNDGGLMPQAVSLSERFLPKGKKVVSIQSKIAEQRKEYSVAQNMGFKDLPLVVLVNEKSASASEIFSGAMQDYRRATVIGVKTYGKGSVQSVIPLDDVSAMKLTTARYVTPSGRIIDGIGLTPDIVVQNGTDGAPGSDRQILEAVAFLKKYM